MSKIYLDAIVGIRVDLAKGSSRGEHGFCEGKERKLWGLELLLLEGEEGMGLAKGRRRGHRV